jgi:hypothetical protein
MLLLLRLLVTSQHVSCTKHICGRESLRKVYNLVAATRLLCALLAKHRYARKGCCTCEEQTTEKKRTHNRFFYLPAKICLVATVGTIHACGFPLLAFKGGQRILRPALCMLTKVADCTLVSICANSTSLSILCMLHCCLTVSKCKTRCYCDTSLPFNHF